MLTITKILRRFVVRTSVTNRLSPSVDQMSLRDWADLPVHRPHSDPSSF